MNDKKIKVQMLQCLAKSRKLQESLKCYTVILTYDTEIYGHFITFGECDQVMCKISD